MDTSLKLTAHQTLAAQSGAALPRSVDNAAAAPVAQEAAPSVTVSISAAARTAEQAARVESSAPPRVAAPATPARVAALQPDAAAAARSASEANGVRGGEQTAEAARAPDAPTAANRPAVQLYLDNASRPDNQPPTSPLRASA